MGFSADEYVRQLIEDDLALDVKAQTTPLHELAAPFRNALEGASEEEIAGIVARARPRRRRGRPENSKQAKPLARLATPLESTGVG